jgi:hypothetical protein
MSKWQDPVYSMMTRFCSKENYEQIGTKATEIHSGQADRHFAAHYRLFLN